MTTMLAIPDALPDDFPDAWGAAIDPVACRALWAQVLISMWNDSFGAPAAGQATARIRREAQAWFGTRDFGIVCRLSGVEPVAVLARWRAEQADWQAQGCPVRSGLGHQYRAYTVKGGSG